MQHLWISLLYEDIDSDMFHSPQIFSLAIRRVGSFLLQVGPVREGHGGPAPSATWASSSSPPSLSPDQIRPPGTHEVPVHKCHQDLEKVQAGDFSGRSWADVTDLDAGGQDIRGNYSPHRHHTSHTFIHLDLGHFCVRVTISGRSITFSGITFSQECKNV